MLSEKYLAGFIDADGHLSVRARLNARPDLELSIAQRSWWAEPLKAAQEMFGGAIREKNKGRHIELQLRGSPARKAFERLKKYMVLKRHHAEAYLALVDESPILRTTSSVCAVRDRVKAARKIEAAITPNYPARKWLAGYVDGDGSFTVKTGKSNGYGYPVLSIVAAPHYQVGIQLLHKVFGGNFVPQGLNQGWNLYLGQPSKAKEFLRYFSKYSIIKGNQVRFLLGCAENGNFRDGTTILQTIKALNAQQHRLSDSDVFELIKKVNFNIPKKPLGRPVGVIETRKRKRQSKLMNMQ